MSGLEPVDHPSAGFCFGCTRGFLCESHRFAKIKLLSLDLHIFLTLYGIYVTYFTPNFTILQKNTKDLFGILS